MNAGHMGNPRSSADIDEDPGGGQLLVPDADRVRALESGVPPDDRAAIHLSQRFLDALARVGGNRVSPRLHLGHVDPHVAVQHDAVVGGPTREMCGIRSTNATVIPARVRRPASEGPACPDPMMMASKRVIPAISSRLREITSYLNRDGFALVESGLKTRPCDTPAL